MILWLVLAALMALTLAFLVRPLTRQAAGRARGAAYDLEVYRDQLAEIDRDRARGVIDEAEAAAARLEVQRRMLGADARAEKAASTAPLSSRAVLVIALIVPLAAGSLYVGLGRPDLVGVAVPKQATRRGPTAADIAAARKMTPQQRIQMIRGMVEGLAARLEQNPNNLQGWLRLGRAYEVLGERTKAADAFGRAAALAPKNIEVQSRHALAMLRAHPRGKPLTSAIRRKLLGLLALDPKHPLGLYYAGVFAAEAGRTAEAIRHWETLISVLPLGAAGAGAEPVRAGQIRPEGARAPENRAPKTGTEDARPDVAQAALADCIHRPVRPFPAAIARRN
jgi:cytochrome c-type biogenesis protein CcmH